MNPDELLKIREPRGALRDLLVENQLAAMDRASEALGTSVAGGVSLSSKISKDMWTEYFNNISSLVDQKALNIVSTHRISDNRFTATLLQESRSRYDPGYTVGIDFVEDINADSDESIAYIVGPSKEICDKYIPTMKFKQYTTLALYPDMDRLTLPWTLDKRKVIFIRGKGFDSIETKISFEEYIKFDNFITKINQLRGLFRCESKLTPHPDNPTYQEDKLEQSLRKFAPIHQYNNNMDLFRYQYASPFGGD